MRARVLIVFVAAAANGCGLGLTGTLESGVADGGDASTTIEGGGPSVGDASPSDATTADDGAIVDAEADRPDAGVPFAPLHIGATSYDVNAPDVTVALGSPVQIDTKTLTIKIGNGAPATSPRLTVSGGIAVWSVGALTTYDTIDVLGDRPLAIVAIRDVVLNAWIDASARHASSGPGGSALGDGAGKPGAKMAGDLSGGGGAGHGQAGGIGGDHNGAKGGAAGSPYNATGTFLTGGSGGGNGGGFVAATTCGGAAMGGAGGGAVQISSAGSITINATGGIAVNGGGGRGGCKGNGGNQLTGGGGGGSGGLVFLESVGGIAMFGGIDARGGGGGEGGDGNSTGSDGDDPGGGVVVAALGGFGTNGGNGGNGGATGTPGNGETKDTGGGGGGGTGRVFFRTRGKAPTVTGLMSAVRTDDPTF